MKYLYIYRRDVDGSAAYVGQTNDINKRHNQHMATDDWCNEDAFGLFYSVVENKHADDIERWLIHAENPTYNKTIYQDYTPTYEINNLIKQLKWIKYKY